MVAALSDYQFDLDDFVFGQGKTVFLDEEGFDPGESVEILQDGVNTITGARTFGRDMRGAKTWTFSCHVDRTDATEAVATLAEMGGKWLADKWLQPTTVAMLRYALAGRTRVVFGKPRKFSHVMNNQVLAGTIPPVATFDLVDNKHYDDVEQFVDLGREPTIPGGFEAPFYAPLIVELPANVSPAGGVVVGGDTSTAPVVTFTGPLTDGVVKIGTAIEVGFTGSLDAGQTLTVDARPWAMSISTNGGTDIVLTRKTRLARAQLAPGTYAAVLTGVDATGTGKARVRWRNAYTTL